jgi:hypothetical protein
VPLGTESEWGWHSFPNTSNFKFGSTLKRYHINGRDISYAVQWNEPAANKQASDWFRQNPHRLQLGNIGLVIRKEDGSIATINDIKNIHQLLDLWSGRILSSFTVENIPVSVTTVCHPQQDLIAAIVESTLIRSGRLKVFIRFPYPTGDWADVGTNWNEQDKHSSKLTKSNSGAVIHGVLDSTQYWVEMRCSSNASYRKNRNTILKSHQQGLESLNLLPGLRLPALIHRFPHSGKRILLPWQNGKNTGYREAQLIFLTAKILARLNWKEELYCPNI